MTAFAYIDKVDNSEQTTIISNGSSFFELNLTTSGEQSKDFTDNGDGTATYNPPGVINIRDIALTLVRIETTLSHLNPSNNFRLYKFLHAIDGVELGTPILNQTNNRSDNISFFTYALIRRGQTIGPVGSQQSSTNIIVDTFRMEIREIERVGVR